MCDISMCSNGFCPLKEECYRFNAKPNEFRQSYGQFEFRDGNCDHFWEMKHQPTKQL